MTKFDPLAREYIDVKGPLFLGWRVYELEDGAKVRCRLYTSHSEDNDYSCEPYEDQE